MKGNYQARLRLNRAIRAEQAVSDYITAMEHKNHPNTEFREGEIQKADKILKRIKRFYPTYIRFTGELSE